MSGDLIQNTSVMLSASWWNFSSLSRNAFSVDFDAARNELPAVIAVGIISPDASKAETILLRLANDFIASRARDPEEVGTSDRCGGLGSHAWLRFMNDHGKWRRCQSPNARQSCRHLRRHPRCVGGAL